MESPEPTAPKGTLPSLRFFLLGIAPWAITAIITKVRLFDSFNAAALVLTILMVLVTPWAFTMGMRRARAERRHAGLRPRLSWWLNLVGLGCYVGLVVVYVLRIALVGD